MGRATMNTEPLKIAAAECAMRYVRSNITIGLGTGSTVYHFVERLGERYRQGAITNIVCLSTSEATTRQAKRLGLPMASYDELLASAPIDVTIDGADNINRRIQLVKGGGGALTREKIVAYNSRAVVIIGDDSKYAPQFAAGTIVPLEALECAAKAVTNALARLRHRGRALFDTITVRREKDETGAGTKGIAGAVYHSDNGNIIIDARFHRVVRDARRLEYELNAIPGVLENGLFAKRRFRVVLASPSGVRCYEHRIGRRRASTPR